MPIRTHAAGADSRDPQDVILAIFDVLGFKARIQSSTLEDLGENYRHLLRLTREAARIPVLSLSGVDQWNSPSAVFSDTIVFWAHTTPESVDSFLTTCSLLLAESLKHDWPLRGAIAAGRCILDRDARVFIGQPIVDAYLLEQAQDWVGAAVHPSCVEHPVVGKLVLRNDNVVKYDPPLKSSYITPIKYAIEWGSRTGDWERQLVRLAHGCPANEQRKYDAAADFIRATREAAFGKAGSSAQTLSPGLTPAAGDEGPT